jgi:hypothetical protein
LSDRRVTYRLMHAQDARFVFVRVMGEFWIRTDACVAFVDCPTCKSEIGACCVNVDRRTAMVRATSGTHHTRRRAATELLRQQEARR